MTENQRILESTRICAVKVKALKTEKRATVVTIADVEPVEPCLKGETEKSFKVMYPGGTYIEKRPHQAPLTRRTMVPGTPHLREGQVVVLYLWRSSPRDTFTVHSWANGVMPLEWDATRKEFMLQRPTENIMAEHRQEKLIAPKTGDKVSAASKKTAQVRQPQPLSLKSFRDKVEQVMKAQPNSKSQTP